MKPHSLRLFPHSMPYCNIEVLVQRLVCGRRDQVNPVVNEAKEVPSPTWILYTEKINSECSIAELKLSLDAQYELERI